jgi:flavodoxin
MRSEANMKKILVAYFSRKGQNYVNGNIVDLPIGNTEVVAKIIQKITGSDIFQIEPAKPYPEEKTVVPFCTHEGSGLGRSEQDITKTCQNTKVLNGIAIHGALVDAANAEITEWLRKIDITK